MSNLNKPQVVYIAGYECPDNCCDAITYEFPSKEIIPSTHPETGTPLLYIWERINTLLWGKEGSDSAVVEATD